MIIKSVKFIKGAVGQDDVLMDGKDQIAFIGRSNVGKSSLINTLTNTKISRTSSFPGRTQEANIFLVNNEFYLIDLPGYGFARASGRGRALIEELIETVLFSPWSNQKRVVLVIDAEVGMTAKDIGMFEELQHHGKNFVIVANKIDKMNQSQYQKSMNAIKKITREHRVIPFSTTSKKHLPELIDELFT
jgi:GTP-binding protein